MFLLVYLNKKNKYKFLDNFIRLLAEVIRVEHSSTRNPSQQKVQLRMVYQSLNNLYGLPIAIKNLGNLYGFKNAWRIITGDDYDAEETC